MQKGYTQTTYTSKCYFQQCFPNSLHLQCLDSWCSFFRHSTFTSGSVYSFSSIENALSSRYLSARLPFLPHSTLCLKITFWWESNWLQYFKFPSSHSLLCLALFFPRHLLLLKPEIPYRLFTRHGYTHKADVFVHLQCLHVADMQYTFHDKLTMKYIMKTTICPHGLPFSARSKEISYSQLFLGGNLVHGWENDICKDWHKETALGAPPLHSQYTF